MKKLRIITFPYKKKEFPTFYYYYYDLFTALMRPNGFYNFYNRKKGITLIVLQSYWE